MEEVPALLRERESKNEVLKLTNISKIYSSGKQAVDNLSLKMYQD